MDLHYCEIPIKVKVKTWYGHKTVTHQQGFLFSTLAWFLVWQDYGWDLEELTSKPTKELMTKIVYYAAKVANYDKGLPAKFTILEMASWLEECPTKYTDELAECYKAAMTVMPEEMKKIGDKSVKKK